MTVPQPMQRFGLIPCGLLISLPVGEGEVLLVLEERFTDQKGKKKERDDYGKDNVLY